ncbi:MAG: ABC transporter ATP-binding protein/permease [Odoribacteraceae bacterium]|jgi:ATP-binding cassette subfamily B protein|nr:ABC transporter ATP-binding protein/permease [Odoribacteraceae bacterium]
MNTLKRLQFYAGGRKALFATSMLLSALSALAGLLPYVAIWFIVRELFAGGGLFVDKTNVVRLAWWAVAAGGGGVLLYFGALCASHLAAFRVEANVRKEATRRVVAMPLGFFDEHASGRVRKVIDDNAGVTHSFLAHQLPDVAGTAVALVAVVVMLFAFEWRLGIACLVPVAAALGMMASSTGSRGKVFMERYMNALEEMNVEAVEYVRGIPVVKVFQQTVFSFKRFYRSIMEYNRMVKGYSDAWEKPMAAYTVIVNSFAFFLVPVSILLVGRGGDLAGVLLDLFLFVLVTPVFSGCVMKSMYIDQAMGLAGQAVERLENLTSNGMTVTSEGTKPVTGHDICFDRVSFTYPGMTTKALDDVSFRVPRGMTIALVGASGSGKTTVARLLARFWDVSEGRVLLGGTDVREIAPEALSRAFSFVFQHARLFKMSLLDNIRYGKPDATMEEVEQVVDQMRCRDIVDRQAFGLNALVGAGGTSLSGGEQQRILLARAMLRDAPVVVLDEATAFADPESEHLIYEALATLTRGKTTLLIAHRLTSVVHADAILVFDKGRIVESGKHEELVARNGLYARMWNEYRRSVRWTLGREARHD